MSDLNFTERLKIRSLSAEQRRRQLMTRALSSPLLRWKYASAAADQILIVPQDLRSADPSFWFEFQSGNFGLANEIADLKGASPFTALAPSLAWERELHGFSWLRHFAAAAQDPEDAPAITAAARDLVVQWIGKGKPKTGTPGAPDVIARRLMSWIAHAHLLLEATDAKTYTAIMSSISQQLQTLKTTWRNAPDGIPRMTCLIGLVVASLAVAGNDKSVSEAEAALLEELNRQILPDGGHISRNASVLADLVLDLLPLTQCFQARGIAAPDAITDTVKRALAFLRFMRMGDGMLARFNGVSTGAPATISTALGYCSSEAELLTEAPQSEYARLECGDTIVIADIGTTPPIEVATEAQAGTLAFEMSSKTHLVFVNGGFPGDAYGDWSAAARATVSHSTVSIAETSSARLVRHDQLEAMIGGVPVRGPELVVARLLEDHGAKAVAASHDGYVKRYGIIHNRRLILSASGDQITGLDTLDLAQQRAVVSNVYPYAVHFHLHPDCRVRRAKNGPHLYIDVADETWVFSTDAGPINVEESLFFVDSAGPRPSVQLVIRGALRGPVEVRWTAKRDSASQF